MDRINFMKHGIRFRTAAKVFPDPKKMIREGEEYPEGLRYYQTTIKSLMAR